MQKLATKVVAQYGKTLAQLEPGLYGFPESWLPYQKEQIRTAIIHLLKRIGPENNDIREGLVNGYVYLAQFIPDVEANLVARGQAALSSPMANIDALKDAPKALKIINTIKLEMEQSLDEIKDLFALN